VVFSSVTFLFLFLPLFLLVYYALPFRLRSAWILTGSWIFYGWWRLDFLALLVLAASSGWFIGKRVAGTRDADPRAARHWLTVGVTIALGVLAYFKYFNFGVESLSMLLSGIRGEGITAWHVILPIGISFYTFQIISYIVDVYRGDAPVARSFVDVAAYVSLFPQLVAGPIVRYREIADQLRERDHNWEKLNRGAVRFMVGLARKVLIADAVAPLADAVFGAASPGLLGAWLGVAAYSVQIYFDFAAYSDMAVGMGWMLGFRFPENFDVPYHSASITEFWRRWHMTLSRWLRDYLYIPLGGNRRGSGRTIVNLMTVMALGGLWHGAAWSFLLWGLWHGVWLVGERLAGGRFAGAGEAGAARGRGAAMLRRFSTLVVVMVGWVLFRAETFPGAVAVYRGMIGLAGLGLGEEVAWQVGTGALVGLGAGTLVVILEPWIRTRVAAARVMRGAMYLVFAMSLVRVLAASYSPFLYFQF